MADKFNLMKKPELLNIIDLKAESRAREAEIREREEVERLARQRRKELETALMALEVSRAAQQRGYPGMPYDPPYPDIHADAVGKDLTPIIPLPKKNDNNLILKIQEKKEISFPLKPNLPIEGLEAVTLDEQVLAVSKRLEQWRKYETGASNEYPDFPRKPLDHVADKLYSQGGLDVTRLSPEDIRAAIVVREVQGKLNELAEQGYPRQERAQKTSQAFQAPEKGYFGLLKKLGERRCRFDANITKYQAPEKRMKDY